MKMLSLLAAGVLFSGVAVANAAEPVALTDTQLESVTAGVVAGTADAAANAVSTALTNAITESRTSAEVVITNNSSRSTSASHAAAAGF
jgi:hypothetical protein